VCGEIYYRSPGGWKDAAYCSPRCGVIARMRRYRKRKAQKAETGQ